MSFSVIVSSRELVVPEIQRFKKSWLNPPYNNRNKIVEDSQPGGCLSQEVAQVLLGVHDRDGSPPESPSNQDILLLKELYGKSFIH